MILILCVFTEWRIRLLLRLILGKQQNAKTSFLAAYIWSLTRINIVLELLHVVIVNQPIPSCIVVIQSSFRGKRRPLSQRRLINQNT